MAKLQNCDFEISEFELQSHYYFHFRINTIGKGMNTLIPRLNYKDDFGVYGVWYAIKQRN